MSSTASWQAKNAEKAAEDRIEDTMTTSKADIESARPPVPNNRPSFANPSPLGLISFATCCILIFSLYGVEARGIKTPNLVVGNLVFFGGVCQFIAGILEFISGNTFGATVFSSYAAFNLTLAMIYIPGSGIIAAYTDPSTNQVTDEFHQALAMYLFAWMVPTIIYAIAAMRTNWVLVLDLSVLSVEFLLLACGNMLNNSSLLIAGNSLGFIVCFLTYWAGVAGLWDSDLTPIRLPTFPIKQ